MESDHNIQTALMMPDGNGGFMPCPEVLTEEELICFLRIPEISKSKDYSNAIKNLKRIRNLPRLHLCGQTVYPVREILRWISEQTEI